MHLYLDQQSLAFRSAAYPIALATSLTTEFMNGVRLAQTFEDQKKPKTTDAATTPEVQQPNPFPGTEEAWLDPAMRVLDSVARLPGGRPFANIGGFALGVGEGMLATANVPGREQALAVGRFAFRTAQGAVSGLGATFGAEGALRKVTEQRQEAEQQELMIQDVEERLSPHDTDDSPEVRLAQAQADLAQAVRKGDDEEIDLAEKLLNRALEESSGTAIPEPTLE